MLDSHAQTEMGRWEGAGVSTAAHGDLGISPEVKGYRFMISLLK